MQKILKQNKWNDSVYLTSFQQTQYKHDKLHDIKQPDFLLQNQLIASQKNIVCRSLSDWASELRSAIRDVYGENTKIKCAARIAEIFNQAIHIFMFLENHHDARELCYTQIQMFTAWSTKANARYLLKYIFQPWLHLIQLNRLEGNLYDAFIKLNALNIVNHAETVWGENKLLTQMLYQALQQDVGMYKQIINQSVIERILLCFESKRYDDLIIFIENKCNRVDDIIIQEARAVSYANSGKIHEAFNVLGCNDSNMTKDLILILRNIELRLSLGWDSGTSDTLSLIYDSAMRLMNLNNITMSQLAYLMHAAYVLRMAKLTDMSIKLVYFCLETAIKMGDEVLRANCLTTLYELLEGQKARQVIEDLMITHYYNTQYVGVQKNMLQFFQDLKYVESKNHHDVITPLFEDLLVFDIHC